MADNHMKGTVRWFSARRGYGFLSDENGVDYFVHYSEITGDGFKKLSAGEPVEFMAGEDGHRAGNAGRYCRRNSRKRNRRYNKRKQYIE